MEIKHYGYLLFLIAMFAEEAQTSIVVGGGMIEEIVNGGDGNMEFLPTGGVPSWIKVVLEKKFLIKKLVGSFGIDNDEQGQNRVGHLLLLEDKDDTPDPEKHFICGSAEGTSTVIGYPKKEYICDSLELYGAVAGWAQPHAAAGMVYLEVYDERGNVDIARGRPITGGGGCLTHLVDVYFDKDCPMKGSSRNSWVKFVLDAPAVLKEIWLNVYIRNYVRESGWINFLMLADALAHVNESLPSCGTNIVKEDTGKSFDYYQYDIKHSCFDEKEYPAVAVLFSPNMDFELYKIRVSGADGLPVTITAACTFAASTSVLLGCQVLVLLIQHIVQ